MSLSAADVEAYERDGVVSNVLNVQCEVWFVTVMMNRRIIAVAKRGSQSFDRFTPHQRLLLIRVFRRKKPEFDTRRRNVAGPRRQRFSLRAVFPDPLRNAVSQPKVVDDGRP